MSTFVVDENVPIVANDGASDPPRTPQADDACRLECVSTLTMIVKKGIVAIDDAGEVIDKYRRNLRAQGQPGTGDAFFRHVLDRQYDKRKVRRISLAKDDTREFKAFPNDVELATFDRSDRIYVSLALSAGKKARLVNAVDSDYAQHAEALARHGVNVLELCRHCLRI